jgi:murein DD-endopeptidase MepM/ murein hydrolase activator NlpD
MPDTESELAVLTVGTVLETGSAGGAEAPEGYTMDKLSLGTIEPVAPVFGVLTSDYGYRDHPISGKHRFHGGVDIGAEEGTPIVAFSDGRVEYIGEDNSFGLYLQIDHGNGVKSFYAHCRELCVRKDQRIEAGETVALVGSTGTTTGPHLHLELKCEGVRVNPAHYMSFVSEQ